VCSAKRQPTRFSRRPACPVSTSFSCTLAPGRGRSTGSSAADAILVDSYSESGLGGTGRAFDWEREADAVRRIVAGKPLVLAGGLDAENVGAAIRALAPDVVDVSSGVESSPGVKDHGRMRAFASAVAVANAG